MSKEFDPILSGGNPRDPPGRFSGGDVNRRVGPRPDVTDALIVLFKDTQPTLRWKGAVVLGRMGQRDVSVYNKVAPNLASKDNDILVGAMRALGDMGGIAEPSLPQIVFIMEESPDPALRNEAAEALIKMGTTASLSAAERYTRGQYDRRSKEKSPHQ